MTRAYTLLEFIEAGIVIHTQQVAWPGNSLSYVYPATAPAAFDLRASIIVPSGWSSLASPTQTIHVVQSTY